MIGCRHVGKLFNRPGIHRNLHSVGVKLVPVDPFFQQFGKISGVPEIQPDRTAASKMAKQEITSVTFVLNASIFPGITNSPSLLIDVTISQFLCWAWDKPGYKIVKNL
ncbi:hypothetical protein [Brevibacillus massiliensis]|uniref:hypothetical protein n=1 Tax=Brevibacillus massiliensis TaxID=1118054 RepID=UPI0009D954D4|nr:hypothetical protein [Brevibacillus massiliensis]